MEVKGNIYTTSRFWGKKVRGKYILHLKGWKEVSDIKEKFVSIRKRR